MGGCGGEEGRKGGVACTGTGDEEKRRVRGAGGGLEQCGSRRASCVRDSQGQTRRRRSGELKAIAGSPVDVGRPCAAALQITAAASERHALACSASGGACSNGLSPKFTRYRRKPDNAGDKKGAAMLLNAAPLGAAKLQLTAAPLNMPQRAVPHVDRKADDVSHGPCAAVSLGARRCLSLRTADLYC